MKPRAFAYHRPRTVPDAIALLAEFDGDAKILAGGQSLVPAMNFRIVAPPNLIDIGGLSALSYVDADAGLLRIGAATTQRTLERSSIVKRRWPVVTAAVRHVGHAQIRNRGTVGGSLAHADPAAELPAVVRLLDGSLTIGRADGGRRTVGAEAFFVDALVTALEPTELLLEVALPESGPGTGWDLREISRRWGDFAIVGVATLVHLDDDGRIDLARICFFGVGPAPARGTDGEALLVGRYPAPDALAEAARAAVAALNPPEDMHASRRYRRDVAAVLARRSLEASVARAGERRP